MTSNKVLYLIDIVLCFIEVSEPVYCFFKKGRRGINIDVMPGNMNEIEHNGIYNFLREKNYDFFGKTVLTLIFKENYI